MAARGTALQFAMGGLLTLVIASYGLAQELPARLEVMVTSADGARPLNGVRIILPFLDVVRVSDQSGRALFEGIPASSQLLRVQQVGYNEVTVLIEFPPGGTVEAEIELRPKAIPIDGVEVEVERRSDHLSKIGFYHRRELGFGTFIDRSSPESEHTNPLDLSGLLRGVPGIALRESARGVTVFEGRGMSSPQGPCALTVFIDGVRAGSRVAGASGNLEPPVIDDYISLLDIEAIEVYAGASQVPPQYGGGCGSIVIWTMR